MQHHLRKVFQNVSAAPVPSAQANPAAAWSAEASRRHDREHTFKGLKGKIQDRHGRTLVTSRRVTDEVAGGGVRGGQCDAAVDLGVGRGG